MRLASEDGGQRTCDAADACLAVPVSDTPRSQSLSSMPVKILEELAERS